MRELRKRGHEVVCFVRPQSGDGAARDAASLSAALGGAIIRFGEFADQTSLARNALAGERFDVLMSCMASRTGAPRDAWAIDHAAHVAALTAAQAAGVTQCVLLSAICVQKPRLAFQFAKLAFERHLIESGITYSIVRPTAFFKSLSGQIERVRSGKSFLVFGDGTLTRCKPISDEDLAAYLADCLDDPRRHNQILPIGGPGAALTPRQQGEHLFSLLGKEPRFTHVPVSLLSTIAQLLGLLAKLVPPLAAKAEYARIGHYYATESMLVLDPATGQYDADATPATGTVTLLDYYAQRIPARDSQR